MPRKPKKQKQTVTVLVDGTPVRVTMHPPTPPRTSWYAYWPGQVASRSTGQRDFQEAGWAVEAMLRDGVSQPGQEDAPLNEEEFTRIQEVHFAKKKDQARAAKTLKTFRQAMAAFKAVAAMEPINYHGPITQATPGVCEAFQQKALTLPKNWRQRHPKSKPSEEVARVSPNTVLKWSRALCGRLPRSDGKVAEDACVGEGVMMRHYVRMLHEKSNRTFRRILAAPPAEVARRYGHAESGGQGGDLESKLREATDRKDWAEVARLSEELAKAKQPPAG